jgi:phosphate starvation-inducible PhoH-like protein
VPDPSHRTLELPSSDLALRLSGAHSALLKEVSRQSGAAVSLRGNSIHVVGDDDDVLVAYRFLEDAARLTEDGLEVTVSDVAHSLRGLRRDPGRSLVEVMDQIVLVGAGRRPIAPKTAGQRAYVTAIREHDLTFGLGPAGTGKTYLAMAMASAALLSHKVKRIVLTRPAVEAGERLGFLPGDLAEKVNPYLRPLYDALNDMIEYEKVAQLRSRAQIEVAPLAFMRGRTLNDAFVILDEAQNTTPEQMKMFLTRLGYGSKAVVTGDLTQTDLPRGARSGLGQACEILSGIPGIALHRFTDVDVVRHPLVQRIVVAYGAYEEAEARRREEAERASEEAPGAAPAATGADSPEP